MNESFNSVTSTLEWKEKKDKNESIKNGLVNALWMNMEEIRENAIKARENLEISDGAEKPSKEAFINAYTWFVGLNPKNREYLTVVDFFPNNNPWSKFYIINIKNNKIEYSNQVGHWAGSRGKKDSPAWSPDSYSNEEGSKQSSLWFFKTSEKIAPWSLHIREWLKLTWLEKGINDNAVKRALYIHPAGLEQSEWCFTLPYDKAEWKEWEDKILNQLYKIKNNSIVFAYDSRVFDEYRQESELFTENPKKSSGLYAVNNNTAEIEQRIKNNKREGQDNFIIRGINSIGRRVPFTRNYYETLSKENRECWWKKKEIEMLAAQISKKVDEKVKNLKEKETLQELHKNIDNVWIGFKEEFYKSKTKVRREKIDEWVSDFWEKIDGLISEKNDLVDLKEFCDTKKSEYEKWEKESSKNQRKIPEDEYAENRIKREIEEKKRLLSA